MNRKKYNGGDHELNPEPKFVVEKKSRAEVCKIMHKARDEKTGPTTDQNKLNWRQRRYVEEYLRTGSSQAAYRKSGYTYYVDGKTSYRSSSVLRNPLVKAEVQRRQKEWQDRLEISQERVLREYACIAFSNLADYYEVVDGEVRVVSKDKLTPEQQVAIADISIFENIATGTRKISKVKLHDKAKALEALSKHLGIFAQDNKQRASITVTIDELLNGLPGEISHQVRQRLADDLTCVPEEMDSRTIN